MMNWSVLNRRSTVPSALVSCKCGKTVLVKVHVTMSPNWSAPKLKLVVMTPLGSEVLELTVFVQVRLDR
jgi:hypothetical protein